MHLIISIQTFYHALIAPADRVRVYKRLGLPDRMSKIIISNVRYARKKHGYIMDTAIIQFYS